LILYVSKTSLQHYIATCNVATFLKYSWKLRCCIGRNILFLKEMGQKNIDIVSVRASNTCLKTIN